MFYEVDINLYITRFIKRKITISYQLDKFASYLPAGFMDRASFAYEAIAIREGRLTMMNRDFSREDVDEIIAYLVT